MSEPKRSFVQFAAQNTEGAVHPFLFIYYSVFLRCILLRAQKITRGFFSAKEKCTTNSVSTTPDIPDTMDFTGHSCFWNFEFNLCSYPFSHRVGEKQTPANCYVFCGFSHSLFTALLGAPSQDVAAGRNRVRRAVRDMTFHIHVTCTRHNQHNFQLPYNF